MIIVEKRPFKKAKEHESTENKALEHLTFAALHLNETCDIYWKLDKRDKSDLIRKNLHAIEDFCREIGTTEALLIRAKILKKHSKLFPDYERVQ